MPRSAAVQMQLFGHTAAAIDEEFTKLHHVELSEGAWLEIAPGWLNGHANLFEELLDTIPWREESRTMYTQRVMVPRLYAKLDDDSRIPLIAAMRRALDARYGTRFERVSLALYRDGRDSVAWHGDYVARRMPEALVATVSLGAPRRFLLRRTVDPSGFGDDVSPPASRIATSMTLGWGDLLVMGGSCQRTYQHAIPKVKSASARIAIMFRPVWEFPASADSPHDPPDPDY